LLYARSMKKRTALFIAPVALFSLHCTTVSSDAIRTQGIRLEAVADVKDSDSDAFIDLTFKNGSNYVELGSADQVRCENRGMSRVTILGVTSYSVSVPRKSVGESYNCKFTRTAESYDIVVNQVAPVGALQAGGSWGSTSRDYLVDVPNVAGTSVSASLSGSCITRMDVSERGGGGELRFQTNSLQFGSSVAVGESCRATLEVVRRIDGPLPAGFEGGFTRSKSIVRQDVLITR
jgi:hypothetical protein